MTKEEQAPPAPAKRRLGFFGWLLVLAAVGYPTALLLIILALRLIGEGWWVTTAALYLPRLGFGLPLPVLVLAILIARRPRLLVTQAVAAALLIFPLMGLRLHLDGASEAAAPGVLRLRVLSYNVDSGSMGVDGILSVLRGADADLLLLQEANQSVGEAVRLGLPGYVVRTDGQFLVASRFPLDEIVAPPRLRHGGVLRSPRFMRYRLTTPAGAIRVYNIHPISPRDALDELHGAGFRHEIASGRIFMGNAAGELIANAGLRMLQLQAITDDARTSPDPVLMAGDTNLPHLSWALAHWLGDYRDGFTDKGTGFGYTFPAPRHPWMRIDRVLAGPAFRFIDFHVSPDRGSDHHAVIATLQLAPAPAPGASPPAAGH